MPEKIVCTNSIASTASCCPWSMLQMSGMLRKSLSLPSRTHLSFSLLGLGLVLISSQVLHLLKPFFLSILKLPTSFLFLCFQRFPLHAFTHCFPACLVALQFNSVLVIPPPWPSHYNYGSLTVSLLMNKLPFLEKSICFDVCVLSQRRISRWVTKQ